MTSADLRLIQDINNIMNKFIDIFPKDKYSSFAYGLWRIKEIEEEYTKKRRRRFGSSNGERRKLTFYS